MKQFLLGFFVILILSQSKAQSSSWCAPGAKWYYSSYGFLGSHDFAVLYSYTGDTIYNNRTYNIIEGRYYGKSMENIPYKDTLIEKYKTFLTYMENDVLCTPMGGRDTVADFNANIGDTWLLASDCNGIRRTGTVTATGSYIYKSQSYRTVTCAFTFTYMSTTWQMVTDTSQVGFVEKILSNGNWQNPFVNYCPRDPNIIYDGPSEYFCGYEDNNTAPLQLYPGGSCWKVSGVEENSVKDLVKVYPNPAKDKIILTYPQSAILNVFNSQGELLHKAQLTESGEYSLNTENLAAGIYFIQLRNKTGDLRAKFVKE